MYHKIKRTNEGKCAMSVSIDSFFFSGDMDIDQEIRDDIEVSVIQSKRALPYFREYGGNLEQYLNIPFSYSTMIKIRYDVTSWIAQRNSYVSNGDNGTPDRRAVTSQLAIDIRKYDMGMYIGIRYIPLYATDKMESVSLHMGEI
jgi:hypothetical protein